MLGSGGYSRWHRRLGLDTRAVELLDGIRAAPPSRRVSSGRGEHFNASARFPSIKMQVILQAESRTLELAFLHQADHDLGILEVWDQPPGITLHYVSRGGRPLVVAHTPDFFVLWQDHAGWVECKPLNRLATLAQTQPNRYRQNAAGTWICPPGIAYAKQFGFTYTIVTEDDLDPTLIRNLEYLDDYYRQLDYSPTLDAATVAQILGAVTDTPGITKTELMHLAPLVNMDILHWVIAQRTVYVDLSRCPLADGDHVHIYRDGEQAQIYDLCASTARPAWLAGAEPLRCEPGTPLLWDGKPWRITNVGDTHIYLQLQDGTSETPAVMDQRQLQRLVRGGHISPVRSEDGGATPDDRTLIAGAQRRLLSSAHPNELRRALRRYRHLQRFWAGDLTVLDEASARSLYGFQRRWRAAEAAGRPGFTGLIDRSANSGRAQQLSDEARALLLRSVHEDYSATQQPTVRAAYRAYLGRCGTGAVPPASYETYRITVHQQPRVDQEKARRGRRAAYAAAPFTSLFHGNRHGDYPLQRTHLDHTQIDLEVLSPFGECLGRPWLTALFDAYSRRVLAFYLTFDAPSYRSCMMVLRECVRRQGRLPMTIIGDNAPEFGSVYLETLLATYQVVQESRPKARARYGAVIERMFGTMNSEFIHTLLGNTQIMRRVREMTKSVDPRGQAVWTLPALYDALTEWCYEVYDQHPHAGLHHRSPRAVFLAGQAGAGARTVRYIPYDKEFLWLTEPTTPKGTARVSANGLVKVNNILYSCPEFATGRVQRTDVPVRYDPDNSGHIHAQVNGVAVACRANNYDIFAFRSEREIALATKEIRALDRQAGRMPIVSHGRLVEFFLHIQGHEQVLLQHKRDQEVRRAHAGNSASLGDARARDADAAYYEAYEAYEAYDADEAYGAHDRDSSSLASFQGEALGNAVLRESGAASVSAVDAADATAPQGIKNASGSRAEHDERTPRQENDASNLCDDF